MIMKNIVFWFVGLILVSLSYGCYIQGTDSGTCDARLSSEPDYKKLEMPFCGPIIDYTPCVPEQKAVNPDRNFNQDGRWANHTTLTKDRWIEKTVKEMIKYRLGLEVNNSLLDKGEDEYGIKGGIEPRFHRNADCRNAYKNYFCWINFPRCDGNDQSLMTCRSSCENFFRVCGYEDDLWRCGPSKFFNGYGPEDGKLTRDYFPGQPFRDFDPLRKTCTPSIEGAASLGSKPSLSLASFAVFVLTFTLWYSSSS
mmetsp:Transcript_45492/g.58336  ORF Transcript_45492/g.58336 Transcript_45492/m.58336 type:complete len:253 (+) Transcript_45492:81-839(+)